MWKLDYKHIKIFNILF